MTTHNFKKRNKKKRNIKRAAHIKCKLLLNGFKMSDIATDLGISRAAVYRSINCLSTISRVDEWLMKNLKIDIIGD